MCNPRAAAHRSVRRSPQFAPSGPPPASKTIPSRLKATASTTCRENHAYAATDDQRPACELLRVDRDQRGSSQDEADRQERDDAIDGDRILNHDERPAPNGSDSDE